MHRRHYTRAGTGIAGDEHEAMSPTRVRGDTEVEGMIIGRGDDEYRLADRRRIVSGTLDE